MAAEQLVKISRVENVTVLAIGPDFPALHDTALETLGADLLAATQEADPAWIVLDLTNIEFFGSSFIEILFRMWNRVQMAGDGKFAICGLSSYCKEVLTITHLDKLWTIVPTQEEAINHLLGR